ncbi:MAG: metal-sensitive transcriptional regulator [Terriglobia bacterium]
MMNDEKNTQELVTCACEIKSKVKSRRKAVAVDPDLKSANLKRLRRLEGQIRGLQKMVEQDRYCPDILMQISSVQEALRGVSRNLMRNHLRHCTSHAILSGNLTDRELAYQQILDLMYKHVRI